MFGLFESKDRRIKDAREIRQIYSKYGDEAVTVLKARAKDGSLPQRDRKHWARMARKARLMRGQLESKSQSPHATA